MKLFITIFSSLVCLFSAIASAQDCSELQSKTAPDSAFEVSGEVVKDLRTGLTWARCPMGISGEACDYGVQLDMSWYDMSNQIVALNSGEGFASKNDWRLPNIKELYSLVENSCSEHAVNTNIFPWESLGEKHLWASTPDGQSSNADAIVAQNEQMYWLMNLQNGGVTSARSYFRNAAVLVRNSD